MVNVYFMEYYEKLIATIIDSSLIMICNFLIVNDKIEQLSVTWIYKKFKRKYQGNGIDEAIESVNEDDEDSSRNSKTKSN